LGNPALAHTAEDGSRFYPWAGELFWSVSTIIGGGVPKYALAPWSAKMVADLVASDIQLHGPHSRAHAALRRWAKAGRAEVIERQAAGELKTIKLDKLSDVDLALRYLKGQPDRVRDAAAEIGSDVHAEAEAHALRLTLDTSEALIEGTELPDWPDHLLGYMGAFKGWLADWQPSYLATEATVFNRPQAYAGTLDAIVWIRAALLVVALARVGDPIPAWLMAHHPDDMVIAIVDYKSGNRLYAEVAMQLSAYARAEFVGLPDGVTEAALPWPIECGLALHLTPKGYHLKVVDIGDAVFAAFKYAREIYRWTKELAPTVLGKDLAPERKKVAA
jgi:hypothetical protein